MLAATAIWAAVLLAYAPGAPERARAWAESCEPAWWNTTAMTFGSAFVGVVILASIRPWYLMLPAMVVAGWLAVRVYRTRQEVARRAARDAHVQEMLDGMGMS